MLATSSSTSFGIRKRTSPGRRNAPALSVAPVAPAVQASVFSWNEFLCPMVFLQQNVPPSPAALAALHQVDQCIAQVLLHARQQGPVFVLCESGAKFMETMCPLYFPLCAQLFASREMQQSIQLICAATALTPAWHGQMLHLICTERLPRGASYALTVCGGDSMRNGAVELARFQPSVCPKVVRQSQAAAANATKTVECLLKIGQSFHQVQQHQGPLEWTL